MVFIVVVVVQWRILARRLRRPLTKRASTSMLVPTWQLLMQIFKIDFHQGRWCCQSYINQRLFIKGGSRPKYFWVLSILSAVLTRTGPWAPPAKGALAKKNPGPWSCSSINNKIISFKKIISPQPVGGPQKEKKFAGPWERAQCAHWLRRPWGELVPPLPVSSPSFKLSLPPPSPTKGTYL